MNINVVITRLCYGGAEHVGVMLANGLCRQGHEVTVVSNLFDDVTYQLDEGIRVRNLVPTNDNKIRKWVGAVPLMRKYLKEDKPDVVIGIMSTASFVVRVAAIGLHIPVVMTEHDAFERPSSAKFSFWNRFSKFTLNRLYQWVTVLTTADKRIADRALPNTNVVVIPNPLAIASLPIKIDQGVVRPLPETEAVLSAKENIVLAAGRLEDWEVKGFDLLIRAWKEVRARSEAARQGRWRLIIAGKETKESLTYLKSLCQECGVETSVEFLGFRKDVEQWYRRASVFALSSRYEGFGLVLTEAMSQGCACVACDYKGRQNEIMNGDVSPVTGLHKGENGVLVETESADLLAEGLQNLIEDEAYRQNVQLNAIRRSEAFSEECIVERWEKLLNEVRNIEQ